MKTTLVAALLLAAPIGAFAQTSQSSPTYGTSQGNNPVREPNMANPQDQTNQQAQPPNASTDTNSGQATSMPTPTLGNRMTPTNNSATPH